MKKLLVALVALTTVSAFADGHSMVKLNGCFDGQCDNLNVGMSSDDADAKNASQNIALNYAMAFGGNFGAGLTYITNTETVDGDIASGNTSNYNTIGLSFYWNKDGSFSDSCFAALHYDMKTTKDDDTTTDSGKKNNTITLEYGHRYSIGKVMGVTMNWSPSVTYAMDTRVSNNSATDDLKTNTLALNVANFAATF